MWFLSCPSKLWTALQDKAQEENCRAIVSLGEILGLMTSCFCFTHKLLLYAPTSPTSPCFAPLYLWCLHASVPFHFVLPENPIAVTHAPFSSPFSVAALLCYPSSDPTFVLFGSTQQLLKARVQRKSQRRKATQGYAFASLSPVFSSYQDLFYNVNVLQQHNPFRSLLNKPSQRSLKVKAYTQCLQGVL